MSRRRSRPIVISGLVTGTLTLLATILTGATGASAVVAGPASRGAVVGRSASLSMPGSMQQLRAGTVPASSVQAQRSAATALPEQQAHSAVTAEIDVTYTGFSSQAQAAFQAAVNVWEHQITSSVPIHVAASWTPINDPGVLGEAGPESFYPLDPQAAQYTWLPVALANARAGTDLNGSTPEIQAQFNSSFSYGGGWYYGTDGHPGVNQWDLESVVLHELGHGLGFISSADMDSYGNAYLGDQYGQPFIFDTFLQTANGTPLRSLSGANLSSAFTSGGIYWGGAAGKAALGGNRPRLYAPSPWEEGSSISHMDEDTYSASSGNALMTPVLNNGESEHDPGPAVRGMFEDMGWNVPGLSGVVGAGDRFVALPQSRAAAVTLTAGHDVTLTLPGHGGLPSSGVDAVVATAEVDHPSADGYLRITPGGHTSSTAVQEFVAHQSVSNMVVVQLGAGGTVTLHLSAGTARVYLDVAGYYQAAAASGGTRYHPLPAARVYGPGTPTLSAGQGYRAISVLGHGGLPSSGVSAVVLSAEVNQPTASGYLRITPAGAPSSTAVQEFSAGRTISAPVTVRLGSNNQVWVRLSAGSAHVYLDVLGWYGTTSDTTGYTFHPVVTGRSYGTGAPALTSVLDRNVSIAGTSGVPMSGAVAVVANVEVGSPQGTGYLRVTPGGLTSSTATQHYLSGGAVSGLVVSQLRSGLIKLHLSSGTGHVFVDVSGFFG